MDVDMKDRAKRRLQEPANQDPEFRRDLLSVPPSPAQHGIIEMPSPPGRTDRPPARLRWAALAPVLAVGLVVLLAFAIFVVFAFVVLVAIAGLTFLAMRRTGRGTRTKVLAGRRPFLEEQPRRMTPQRSPRT